MQGAIHQEVTARTCLPGLGEQIHLSICKEKLQRNSQAAPPGSSTSSVRPFAARFLGLWLALDEPPVAVGRQALPVLLVAPGPDHRHPVRLVILAQADQDAAVGG